MQNHVFTDTLRITRSYRQLNSQSLRNFTTVLLFEKSSLGIVSIIDATGFLSLLSGKVYHLVKFTLLLQKLQHMRQFNQVAQLVKNLPANAGNARDRGLIPGSGRSPGEGNGTPLQYSCVENSMGKGAQQSTVHGAAESDVIGRILMPVRRLA